MKKLFYLFLFIVTLLQADRGVLEKVVDGDTLHFNNATCRILYIDTPESKRNKKAKQDVEQCKKFTLDTMVKMGKNSTVHAKTLVKTGKSYKYEVKGKDKYKRSLCIVYTPNGIFNELMVKDGFAIPYERYLPDEVKYKYHLLAKEAKRLNRGLWKNNNIDCFAKD